MQRVPLAITTVVAITLSAGLAAAEMQPIPNPPDTPDSGRMHHMSHMHHMGMHHHMGHMGVHRMGRLHHMHHHR